jgi:hypothetical protein
MLRSEDLRIDVGRGPRGGFMRMVHVKHGLTNARTGVLMTRVDRGIPQTIAQQMDIARTSRATVPSIMILNFLIAALLAIALTALLFFVCALEGKFRAKRIAQELATFACPNCSRPVGLDSINQGTDCSPWEELWDGDDGRFVHHYPILWKVRCGACSQSFTIRLNLEGVRFGPRLSVDEDEPGCETERGGVVDQ